MYVYIYIIIVYMKKTTMYLAGHLRFNQETAAVSEEKWPFFDAVVNAVPASQEASKRPLRQRDLAIFIYIYILYYIDIYVFVFIFMYIYYMCVYVHYIICI